MGNLLDLLKTYTASSSYPMHMPGHKRRMGALGEPFTIDITEIDGFDNLHHAEGALREAQERAARLYGADETYYLVNGSTCGILAAVAACTSQGGKLLMARNCHKAAYHAAELRGLRAVYLYPKRIRGAYAQTCEPQGLFCVNGAIETGDVEAALAADPEIQAVLVTSPTYDGVVSDVRAIAQTAHRFGVPLIVDEAHGAHFGFHPYFPESSVRLGADVVIHSLHKTLPSLTQTALLHVCHTGKRAESLVDSAKIRKYLGMFETSSPSYVLMAGMDRCVELLEKEGVHLFEAFAGRLQEFYAQAERLENVHIVSDTVRSGAQRRDPSKVIITARGKSGVQIAQYLRGEHQIELEMAAGDYALALTTIADDDKGFVRLLRALEALGREATEEWQTMTVPAELHGDPVCTIAEAQAQPGRRVPIGESAGYISREYGYLYPPGIPLLVPGERISAELAAQILEYRAKGLTLQGLDDYSGKTVEIFDTNAR